MLTMRSLLPLTLILAACWASNPIISEVSSQHIQEASDNYRLPNDVIPVEYNIRLAPTFEASAEEKNFTFEGWSEITLDIKKPTKTITFHARDLQIYEHDIKLVYQDASFYTLTQPQLLNDTQKDFVTISFDKPLATKSAKLYLHFTGKLNDDLRGFYRSYYHDEEGKKIWLATTHFEPIGARRAFPCWDEPQMKAQFTITITIPVNMENYTAISNMDVDTGKSKKGTTVFKKTPKMSTYLVAFVVSDFKATHDNSERFKVWAKPTVGDDAKRFALDYGFQVLEELKNFTNIDYYGKEQQMNKMDQIAVPHLKAGAMENWGLVTYK